MLLNVGTEAFHSVTVASESMSMRSCKQDLEINSPKVV